MLLIVYVFAIIFLSIRPLKETFSMHLIELPVALIIFIVAESQRAKAVQLTFKELTFIRRLIAPIVENDFVTR